MQKMMSKTPIPEIQKILKYKFMEEKPNKVLPLQNYKLLDKTKLGNCVDFAYAVSDLLYHNYNSLNSKIKKNIKYLLGKILIGKLHGFYSTLC